MFIRGKPSQDEIDILVAEDNSFYSNIPENTSNVVGRLEANLTEYTSDDPLNASYGQLFEPT